MQQAQQKFGPDPTYAAGIGDQLLKFGLEAEAVQHWTTYMAVNRNHYESRDCATRLLARIKEPPQRIAFIQDDARSPTPTITANTASGWPTNTSSSATSPTLKRVLKDARTKQNERPLRYADWDLWQIGTWFDAIRANMEMKPEDKARYLTAIRDVQVYPASAAASLALLENVPVDPADEDGAALGTAADDADRRQRMVRLGPPRPVRPDRRRHEGLRLGRRRSRPACSRTFPTSMSRARRRSATWSRSRCARMGGVGLTIDESSPLAPLLQAALYFRLGDERLAFDAYLANKKLFDENRNQLPVDLLMFVCERLIAGGGDENHDYVEEILRGWLVQYSESMQQRRRDQGRDAAAAGQELLQGPAVRRGPQRIHHGRQPLRQDAASHRSGVRHRRDVPGAEGLRPGRAGLREAGPQPAMSMSSSGPSSSAACSPSAAAIATKPATSSARVLERVPNVELANQALFNLAEVYGAEERYIDQLNLLRTVGRLGRASKRRHTPGHAAVDRRSRQRPGHQPRAQPHSGPRHHRAGRRQEMIYLVGSGAGKGLFRADVETRLGPGDAGRQRPAAHRQGRRSSATIPTSSRPSSRACRCPMSKSASPPTRSSRSPAARSRTCRRNVQRAARARSRAKKRPTAAVSQVRPANQIKPGNLDLPAREGRRPRPDRRRRQDRRQAHRRQRRPGASAARWRPARTRASSKGPPRPANCPPVRSPATRPSTTAR